MNKGRESQRQSITRIPVSREQAGRYVYCIALSGEEVCLGEAGLGGSLVYTVVERDLCAVVHDCPTQPYKSQDEDVAAAWVLAHHRVVDAAWKRWGAVLPLAFNTIIAGDEQNPQEKLRSWLLKENEVLKGKLEALAGKAEYGVQIFWDASVITKKVAEASPEIRKLEDEIRTKPRGLAYMYRRKLESLLKRDVETRAAEEFEALYGRLSQWADAIHVEKARTNTEVRQMLMNLSCLVSTERFHRLEAELDKVSNMEGFSVRLVGPLPPYSFC